MLPQAAGSTLVTRGLETLLSTEFDFLIFLLNTYLHNLPKI
jgi:hypothetical protein